jgi:FlaA1/EpsC-like NDP-sugar epimerase
MNSRSIVVFIYDAMIAVVAWLAAYWLRFNLNIPEYWWLAALECLPWVVVTQIVAFGYFGLYRGIWQFASLSDLRRITLAVGVGALSVPALLNMVRLLPGVPRSVLLLDPLLLIAIMGGSRIGYRAWKDGSLFRGGDAKTKQPVLLCGAGDAAAQLVRELARSSGWWVAGLLDDNRERHGRMISGVRILGDLKDCGLWAERTGARHAIIAMPSATSGQRRRAFELATAAGLNVLVVPALADILAGRVAISQVRKVELEDVLGRDKIELDDVGLNRLLADKVVLITGAGGSIGSELCRQILRFSPRQLVCYDQSEFGLYSIEQEFGSSPVTYVVGDVKEAGQLEPVFAHYRPDVVFHAAAYKHVPMMERENAWTAVRNNVLGTLCIARAAADAGVGEFVLVSTDKAVNPTNVMGASKRLAEMVCQALQPNSTTRFVIVRFGNVLDSSGSVVPKFREQIAKGGPVTVTHPDIIRYFMLIPEAAQLVLQAGLMGKGGETFVLDMGEPVKIVDLARDMIRLSGFSEDEIRIEITGLRPGEKLYEELLADSETTQPTPHPKLRIAKAAEIPDDAWLSELEAWLTQVVRAEDEVKEGLRFWVPEYKPAFH